VKRNPITTQLSRYLIPGLFSALASTSAFAQPDFSKIEITASELAPGVYLLAAEGGGNMALSIGDDGVLLIDDHLAPLNDKVNSAIASLTDQPVRFLVNTHWHFDHTGNNQDFGESGAVIVAHDNVRKRMAKGQRVEAFNIDIPPAPAPALPVMTFGQAVTFHFNNDTLEVVHPSPAHTDGDAVVFFAKANVVHAGDIYWNGLYPLIDGSSGGSTAGMIAAVAAVLDRIDDSTIVIPGHGMPSTKAELQAYHDMLKTVNGKISSLRAQGKSLKQVVADKPSADYDAIWGKGLFAPHVWVGMLYSTP
jgi:cyclase